MKLRYKILITILILTSALVAFTLVSVSKAYKVLCEDPTRPPAAVCK